MIRSTIAIVLTLLMTVQTQVEAQEIPVNAKLRVALNSIRSVGPLPAERVPEQNSDDVYERLMGIAAGTLINVEFLNGAELQGRLGEVSEKDFRILLASGVWQTVAIDQVVRLWIPPVLGANRVPDTTGGWGQKKALIVTGIIVAGILALALYGIRNNPG